jgi:hypothetical protein
VADLAASAVARSKAVTESTSEKSTAAWFRWKSYLRQIDIEDIFLCSFSPEDRWDVLAGFCSALRDGRFQRGKRKGMVQGSISDSLGAVAQTFLIHKHDDPRLDRQGKTAFILLRTLKGLKSEDPPPRKQAPATPELIRLLASSTDAVPLDNAIGKLACGAYFYAMRSCEYLKVSGSRKTKLLLLEDIQFHVENREISHSSPKIFDCDTITITFKDQKNGELMQRRTAWRTNDPILCPVKAWASIVTRIMSYPGCNKKTPVNTVLVHGRLVTITSTMMVTSIRSAAFTLGRDRLGYGPKSFGTHSIRCGAAMAMHLGGCATFVIMITGRWKSAAFMEYIREQVAQFSEGVSQRMILRQNYFAIPAVDIDFLPKEVDPIYTTKTNIGRDAPRQLSEMPRLLLAS